LQRKFDKYQEYLQIKKQELIDISLRRTNRGKEIREKTNAETLEIIEYLTTHTRKETAEKYNITEMSLYERVRKFKKLISKR
jgi:hypothetical protein